VIDRVPDQHDGRVSIVALTDGGRQMAEAITSARQEALGQVVEDWDDADLERLVLLFDRLRAAMRRLS
jgi:DNA-binding MarR family transcriptional regulator